MVLVRVVGLAWIAMCFVACEKIPDWERKELSSGGMDENQKLVELKKYLWTCRGHPTTQAQSEEFTSPGVAIEHFVDWFRSKGLSSLDVLGPKTIAGTAFLYDGSQHLITLSEWISALREVECSYDGSQWKKVELQGWDPALGVSVLKLENPFMPLGKKLGRWPTRTDEIKGGENLSVFSSSYPGQLDRLSVQSQIFHTNLQTGVDEDLVLFLPEPSILSSGGVVLDQKLRFVGSVLAFEREAWGAAISSRRLDDIVFAIINDGKARQPYVGFKLRLDSEGFVVQQIEVGSPAHQAGLRVNDILVDWNQKPLTAISHWTELSSSDIGQNIPLTYKRGEKLVQTQLKVAALE